MIRLTDIHAAYGDKPIFTSLHLTLPASGAVAITGPSGKGKTTLLRLLAGLYRPLSGQIDGLDGLTVSMAFQEDRLLPWYSAYENVLLPLPADLAGRDQLAETWLQRMELGDVLRQYPAALSGGMQRRVALARACAYGGDILLLDEPFQGLDHALRARIAAHIKNAAPLIVLVTHDKDDATLFEAEEIPL